MNSGDIKSDDKTLRVVLNGSMGTFHVSVFQRPYAWEEKQQEELLLDFMNAIEKNEKKEYVTGDFFIGNFIFHKKNKRDPLNIVDGQQRLITTSIILAIIRDLLFIISKKKIKEPLKEQSISLIEEIEKYLYLEEDQVQQPVITPLIEIEKNYFFKHILYLDNKKVEQKKNGSEKSYKMYSNGYNLLKDLIEDRLSAEKNTKNRIAYLRILYRQIISSELVAITIPDEEKAYKIYSNINSKGLYLSEIDLIKNDYFYKTKDNTGIPGIDEETNLWNSIFSTVTKNTTIPFDIFYKHCWYIFHPEDIDEYYGSSISFFEVFQSKYPTQESRQEIMVFFNKLQIISKQFDMFNKPDTVDLWKQYNWPNYTSKLYFMKKISTDSITNKYVLWLFPWSFKYAEETDAKRKKNYERALKELIELISDTLFIYKLLNRYEESEEEILNKLENYFSYIFKEVVKYDASNSYKAVIENFKKERATILGNYGQTVCSLISKLKYSKKNWLEDQEYVRYILNRLNDNREVIVENISGSIEHIREDEENTEESMSIGNLVWLEVNYNLECSKIKNKNNYNEKDLLECKFKIYDKSEYYEVKKLIRDIRPIDFEAESIRKRAEELGKRFLMDYIDLTF